MAGGPPASRTVSIRGRPGTGDTAANSVAGGAGDDQLFGREGDDRLRGGAGDDLLRRGGGADLLSGNAGADPPDGGAGADTLNGGAGNGGAGNGGAGNGGAGNGGAGFDAFVRRAGEAAGDVVADFADFAGNGALEGDRLLLPGFGTAADGARLVRLSVTDWQALSADGAAPASFRLANAAGLHASDALFG